MALFIITAVSPIVFNFNVGASDREIIAESYDCYDVSEISSPKSRFASKESINNKDGELKEYITTIRSIQSFDGLMNSSWPMYCHDVRHTGRSPYSTADNPGDEIWRFKQHKNDYVRSSPVVGDDGTIYFGGLGAFYALYPNGTLKWKWDGLSLYVWSAPAIDENGTVYVGSVYGDYGDHLYALHPNGTLYWKYKTGGNIFSSPAIGPDGAIYFGAENKNIHSLYPNGTVKWKYKTGHVVLSSPTIGNDGTVYCGSHDEHLYALYSNNGTVKWKYKTGHWVRVSPCIADDGTIYVVSLDEYLHAVYPNGTLKWKTNVGAGTSPTIGQDGTIYCGYTELHAVNPTNGSIKWIFDVDGKIRGSTPCNSKDGTIYFGTTAGWVYAINPNGTLKWRKKIVEAVDIDSALAIGEDGTIYIGSSCEEKVGGSIYNVGYLHAFNRDKLKVDSEGPYYGLIDEPVQFNGSAFYGYPPYSWHWDFGDGNTSDEQNPKHSYTNPGNFTITLTVTDDSDNTSDDTTWAWIQETNDPPDIPEIDGPTSGKIGTFYDYTAQTTDPDGNDIWYYFYWGDGYGTGWLGPFDSGEDVTKHHRWTEKGTYNITCKAKDVYGEESDWATLEVTMPKNKPFNFNFNLLSWLFERFPHAFPILRYLLGLI